MSIVERANEDGTVTVLSNDADPGYTYDLHIADLDDELGIGVADLEFTDDQPSRPRAYCVLSPAMVAELRDNLTAWLRQHGHEEAESK